MIKLFIYLFILLSDRYLVRFCHSRCCTTVGKSTHCPICLPKRPIGRRIMLPHAQIMNIFIGGGAVDSSVNNRAAKLG